MTVLIRFVLTGPAKRIMLAGSTAIWAKPRLPKMQYTRQPIRSAESASMIAQLRHDPALGLLLAATLLIPLAQALDLELKPEDYEPAITLKEHENRTVEEYSVNGQRYMMKVNPSHGPSYYLYDSDGSGDFEMRRGAAGADHKPPQWVLFNW